LLLRYVFPDFLPNPDMMKRDKLADKLQRHDMLRRRTIIDIPEFYVGMYVYINLVFSVSQILLLYAVSKLFNK